ncbi:FAD:protein FMN transferase [Brucella sp. BE17]|uniref:FAD:protein FMN transferase n=1 Tax=Brucella sp. BE17 TaxID=3142977 RepID=UPI0031BB888C
MTINRRRLLAAGVGALVLAHIPPALCASDGNQPILWRGQTLGAPAQITLYFSDMDEGKRLLRKAVQEAERLENIFSLYRSDSELVRLNRNGALAMPSPELVELLEICGECWKGSNGMFDPTVQPLWLCLYEHFSQSGADPNGPSRMKWNEALRKVGFQHVLFDKTRIAFSIPGMALTLNGIAQGYITDRVVALLGDAGVMHALVDMGEYRAIGPQPDGTPWKIGLSELETDRNVYDYLDIVDQALATTSASGFQFEDSGRFNHLLNPKTGYSPTLYSRVTVVAPTAARADAWATAFSLMKKTEIDNILENFGALKVITSRDRK